MFCPCEPGRWGRSLRCRVTGFFFDNELLVLLLPHRMRGRPIPVTCDSGDPRELWREGITGSGGVRSPPTAVHAVGGGYGVRPGIGR